MEQQPTAAAEATETAQPALSEELERQYKTLGVRVDTDLHARLSFITQLKGGTLNGEIVDAIRGHVEAAQQDPDLVAKAEEVRAQIEREAEARRAAIAGMFGTAAITGATERADRGPSRRSRRLDTEPI
jgi:hypothetical protein